MTDLRTPEEREFDRKFPGWRDRAKPLGLDQAEARYWNAPQTKPKGPYEELGVDA